MEAATASETFTNLHGVISQEAKIFYVRLHT
jgi:hypothetical protein